MLVVCTVIFYSCKNGELCAAGSTAKADCLDSPGITASAIAGGEISQPEIPEIDQWKEGETAPTIISLVE